MNIRSRIKQHPVAVFIVLAVGLSFAAFLLPVSGEGALLLLLTFLVAVPTVVAFALVAVMEGRAGLGTFLRQSFRWRAPLAWYLIAIALGFLMQFGSSVAALLTGRISAIEIGAPDATLIATLIIFLPFALLEEIGWRGFALRRSLAGYSPFVATLIVGIPWGLIHFGLAMFALNDGRSPVVAGLTVLVLSFPLTWIFIKSGGSVLVVTVLHYAFNVSGSMAGPGRVLSMEETAWFLLVSSCLVAAALVLIDWRMWFTRPMEAQAGDVVPSAVS
jgi:membrane protease YdiL (CAAX protease family)